MVVVGGLLVAAELPAPPPPPAIKIPFLCSLSEENLRYISLYAYRNEVSLLLLEGGAVL
jgi:hypothetical protein